MGRPNVAPACRGPTPGSGHRATVLLATLATLWACGRGISGEFTPLACGDKVDNDGDGLADCKDPDCRGLNACAPSPPHAVDLTPHAGPGPSLASGFGEPVYQSLDDDAGAAGLDEDAGLELKPQDSIMCGEVLCPPGSVCIRDRCLAWDAGSRAGEPGTVASIFVDSAEVRALTDKNANCLEPDCSGANCCRLYPDPYVEVLRNGTTVGRTTTRVDNLRPSWEASFEVEYSVGDLLEVRVIDEDTTPTFYEGVLIDDVEDDLMWQCQIDPPKVRYSCAGPSGSFGTSELIVSATIHAL
ncbi:MAG: hypothetical protein OXU20_42285 [Myxococcales bacterium]|nr:hypothetical protein [Myxococcales bacterium]MDD9970148.1 hypothetical protein [Myxococcales bacterium]